MICRFECLESLGNTLDPSVVVICVMLTGGLWGDTVSKLPDGSNMSLGGMLHRVTCCCTSNDGGCECLDVIFINTLDFMLTV